MSTAATKFTAEKQQKFLDELAASGNVSVACRAAVVTRGEVYKYRKHYPKFRAEWKDAVNRAIDVLEEEARRRACIGVEEPVFYKGEECGQVRKYSDVLLIFLLKGLRPKKYRDNWSGSLSVKHDPKEMTDSELRSAALDIVAKYKGSKQTSEQQPSADVAKTTLQ